MTTPKIPDDVQGMERISAMYRANGGSTKGLTGSPVACLACEALPGHCVRVRSADVYLYLCGHCFDAVEAFMADRTHEYIRKPHWPALA